MFLQRTNCGPKPALREHPRRRTRTMALRKTLKEFMECGGTATWRSGYAAVCKTVYPGSIPGVASSKINDLEESVPSAAAAAWAEEAPDDVGHPVAVEVAGANDGPDVQRRKAVETIATIQNATMIYEEGRTARPPRVLTDERG
jgi:hypothetical protein